MKTKKRIIIPTFLLIFYFSNCHIIFKNNNNFDRIFKKYDTKKVKANLLKAVAIVESGLNPDAVNLNDPSFGLMQILFTGSNKLFVNGWETASAKKLLEPGFNVYIGAQILNWNIEKYGFFRGIICYNNWSARSGVVPYKSLIYFLKIYSVYLRLQ